MPKKSTKSKSKRQTLKNKYKVLKKVKEHHKKLKKAAKKSPRQGKKKTDPGIPTQWPFKAQLIEEIKLQAAHTAAAEKTRKEERMQAQVRMVA